MDAAAQVPERARLAMKHNQTKWAGSYTRSRSTRCTASTNASDSSGLTHRAALDVFKIRGVKKHADCKAQAKAIAVRAKCIADIIFADCSGMGVCFYTDDASQRGTALTQNLLQTYHGIARKSLEQMNTWQSALLDIADTL